MIANRFAKIFFILLLFQQATPAQNDSTKIMQVINRLFDGMKLGNERMVLSVFDSSAILMSIGNSLAKTTLHSEDYKSFARAIGTPHPQIWNESIKNPVIHINGDLASVWAEYTFYLGDNLNHCGVNSFQLIKRENIWKILVITDTIKKEGCTKESN